MKHLTNFLSAYEMPRPVQLRQNLFAAFFPLMKLLPARFMLDRAVDQGLLKRGGHIVETTSGTLGLALAMLSATRGYKLSLVSADSLIDEVMLRRLTSLGAEVHIVGDPKKSGAQIERMNALQEILRQIPAAFWPRQYDNPHNRQAYGRLAEWILDMFGQVDCLIGCVGSGGSLCGTGGFLRQIFPQLTMIAVDTHRSSLFGHVPGPRLLRGLGNSIRPANLRQDMIDEVHWVGALPAFAATRQLYRDHAVFAGPTSGAAALVAGWYAQTNPDKKTLVILPDEGHRYQATVYDDDWLARQQGWPLPVPSGPETLERLEPRDEEAWTRFVWGRGSTDDT